MRTTLLLIPAVVLRTMRLVMAEYHMCVGMFCAVITTKIAASTMMRVTYPSGRAVIISITSPVTSGMIQMGDALSMYTKHEYKRFAQSLRNIFCKNPLPRALATPDGANKLS